jgi:hypothetical protein
MKRKSIFLTIVAMLFAGIAWGQAWNEGTVPTGSHVDGRDTVFFCATTDSLYPLELGYDVSGRKLHPSYGDWSLIAKTSSSVKAVDYNMNSTKNGGAGNAYKTVNSGIGGLLFQYKANDEQCGLEVNDVFLTYVFILPDKNSTVNPSDTLLCYDENNNGGSGTTIDFDDYFKEYINVYKAAGFTVDWKHGGSFTIKRDSVYNASLRDTLLISNASDKYTCGEEISFKLGVRVDSSYTLGPKALTLCTIDTVGDLGNRHPKDIFGRTGVTYEYSTLKGGAATWTDITIGGKTVAKGVFTFTYSTCKPAPNHEGESSDTLYLITESFAPNSYWDKDTITYCRDSASIDIFKLYFDSVIDYPNIPVGKPALTSTGSYWYDRDLGQTPIPDAIGDYSTTTGYPSLKINPIGKNGKGTDVQMDIMKSNVAYNYLWRVDPAAFPCLTTSAGVPDSGTMVVIIHDPAVAQDYTAQLCNNSYESSGNGFDLNAYTGLNVKWIPVLSPALNTDNATLPVNTPGKVYTGTYKYQYVLPPICGPGGTGVFYIKVTDKIKSPVSKTVKYCINKLPASINVNDVLGVAVDGLKWTVKRADGIVVTPTGTVNAGFIADGILDISAYTNAHGAGQQTLLFEVDSATVDCGVSSSTKLTIQFVTVL